MAKIKKQTKSSSQSPFQDYWTTKNFILIGLGLLLLVIGFVVMGHGSWDNPLSLTVSPIILLIAYLVIFPLAILYTNKRKAKHRMILAKIKGNIVSTQKNEHLKSHKLLVVHPIDLEGNFIGDKDMIALDLIDAGIGDEVLVVKEGAAVKQMLGHGNAPVNTMIVAIVDNIDVEQ